MYIDISIRTIDIDIKTKYIDIKISISNRKISITKDKSISDRNILLDKKYRYHIESKIAISPAPIVSAELLPCQPLFNV